jgi:hypothetical protein
MVRAVNILCSNYDGSSIVLVGINEVDSMLLCFLLFIIVITFNFEGCLSFLSKNSL